MQICTIRGNLLLQAFSKTISIRYRNYTQAGLHKFAPLLAVCTLLSTPVSAGEGLIDPRTPGFISSLSLEHFPDELTNAISALRNQEWKNCIRAARTTQGTPSALVESMCLLAADRAAEALERLESILRQQRGDGAALYLRALALSSLGKIDEALRSMNDAIWFNRGAVVKNDALIAGKAALLRRLNRLPEAKQTISAGLASHAGSTALKRELAFVVAAEGSRTDAIRILREIRATSTLDAEADLLLARTLLFQVNRTFQRPDIQESLSISRNLGQQKDIALNLRESAMLTEVEALIALGDLGGATSRLASAPKGFSNIDALRALSHQVDLEKQSRVAERAQQKG